MQRDRVTLTGSFLQEFISATRALFDSTTTILKEAVALNLDRTFSFTQMRGRQDHLSPSVAFFRVLRHRRLELLGKGHLVGMGGNATKGACAVGARVWLRKRGFFQNQNTTTFFTVVILLTFSEVSDAIVKGFHSIVVRILASVATSLATLDANTAATAPELMSSRHFPKWG